MAYILTSWAASRVLSGHPDDELTQWVTKEKVRPMIAIATMGSVLHGIATDTRYSANQRSRMSLVAQEALRDIHEDTGDRLLRAEFDIRAAEILAEILNIEEGQDVLSELDLIPAAIAIQHNHTLIVGHEIEAWENFAGEIAPETGSLTLMTFAPS